MRKAVKEDRYLKCDETYHKILVDAADNNGIPETLTTCKHIKVVLVVAKLHTTNT